MVTTICNGFLWKLWRKTMGKTFEEWYEVEFFKIYIEAAIENSSFDGHEDIKSLMKEAWEVSRQHMTTKDI